MFLKAAPTPRKIEIIRNRGLKFVILSKNIPTKKHKKIGIIIVKPSCDTRANAVKIPFLLLIAPPFN